MSTVSAVPTVLPLATIVADGIDDLDVNHGRLTLGSASPQSKKTTNAWGQRLASHLTPYHLPHLIDGRFRDGAWGALAPALRCEWDSIQKVATGKRAVTPVLALRVLRVERLAGAPELLAGQWLSARVCSNPPEDFVDEETVVE
jgi:hypothetical protein